MARIKAVDGDALTGWGPYVYPVERAVSSFGETLRMDALRAVRRRTWPT
jgi:hypothetical protein